LLLDAVFLATLLDDLLLMQCTLLRGLLVGARRHVLLAVTQGLGLRSALLGKLLLLPALLVQLVLAHVLRVFGLLLASSLRLLGNPLALRGLLCRNTLLGSLALFGTVFDGSPVLGGSLLRTLRGFSTHDSLLACLFGLCGSRVLLAGLGLGLRFFGLLLTAVLLVVTPRFLRARLCNGADAQDGADHDGQDVSTCGIHVHGDPRSGHGRRFLPRDALHGRAT
jgi:hypothetical protein